MRLRRPPRHHAAHQLGTVGYPDAPYSVGVTPTPAGPLWSSEGNVAPSEQVGRYGAHIPTQMATNIPGAQLRCGVEGVEVHYNVVGHGDLPYWLTNQHRTGLGGQLLLTGGSPSPAPVGGVAQTSKLLGPARIARGAAVQQVAAGLLGW